MSTHTSTVQELTAQGPPTSNQSSSYIKIHPQWHHPPLSVHLEDVNTILLSVLASFMPLTREKKTPPLEKSPVYTRSQHTSSFHRVTWSQIVKCNDGNSNDQGHQPLIGSDIPLSTWIIG
ncbi:hypothetical protein OCU04_005522 [Sclerotinia nivalis]|uniref:Uncharacterized protein n=1 Tax=Sclerotinia nivalis TaxID=352851 RepID=A0A9X0APB3_9HELO|nr:hypothetical protein OCU04_005522 [Sclerotinia nivalis]